MKHLKLIKNKIVQAVILVDDENFLKENEKTLKELHDFDEHVHTEELKASIGDEFYGKEFKVGKERTLEFILEQEKMKESLK